jgi:glycosyltransferase involved in cell wall biosynthesis
MRLLLVTEKSAAPHNQRDGGARLVSTLRRHLGEQLDVLQLDPHGTPAAPDDAVLLRATYPPGSSDRFERRLQHAAFVADLIAHHGESYDKVILVHASLAFGLPEGGIPGVQTLLFPMFLTPSYQASGERVPAAYTAAERRALGRVDRILTPSHLERRQLVEQYGVDSDRVRVVPRGVDLSLLRPRPRQLETAALRLCSVGSIKPQKDTLGLVRIFAGVRQRWPQATLRIVGPPQDQAYAQRVDEEIERLGLADSVELTGYVPPEELASAIEDCHLHLSASSCETFGRAIFETLASGLPNLARSGPNAAMEHLAGEPCARFYADIDGALAGLDELLADYPQRSRMACQVGSRFDDAYLGELLLAEILEQPVAGITDYDGTLFHKTSEERTRRCARAFARFPLRVVHSARPLDDLRERCAAIGVEAHFFVALSGAVVADADGVVLREWAFDRSALDETLQTLPPGSRVVRQDDRALQVHVPTDLDHPPPGCRVERYQGESFVMPWTTTKLPAVLWLLEHTGWRGRVRSFGDGPADIPLITFFDGLRLTPTPRRDGPVRESLEIP